MTEGTKNINCPKCGGHEFASGKQTGYGKISPRPFGFGSAVFHTLCLDCGYILESYVKNPEIFK